MTKNIMLLVLVLVIPKVAFAGGMNDDPLLTMVLIDQLEVRAADGSTPLVWDAEGWIGKDLDKLWFKTEGEYVDGQADEVEMQALYSHAIAPFWEVQFGWRRDIRPTPNRDWLAFGVKGLSPYYFDIAATVFVGDSGRTSARLQAEYEIMFTQRLILVPDIELNLYSKDDPATETGSGIANVEAGLRLRYEIYREFAPYIGVNWIKLYGQTADYAQENGGSDDSFQLVVGIRGWF